MKIFDFLTSAFICKTVWIIIGNILGWFILCCIILGIIKTIAEYIKSIFKK